MNIYLGKKIGKPTRLYRPEELGIRLLGGRSDRIPEGARIYLSPEYIPVRGNERHPDMFTLFNSLFYNRGADIFSTVFSTKVSKNPLAAQADAREFAEFMSRRRDSGPIAVLEWGIGNGRYALDFLGELRKIAQSVYNATTYFAIDGSRQMIRDFVGHLGQHRERFSPVLCGPGELMPEEVSNLQNVRLIRFNEFYDDLPATEIAFCGGRYYEMYVRLYLSSERNDKGDETSGYSGLLESVMRDNVPSLKQLQEAASDPERNIFSGKRSFFPYLYADLAYGEISEVDLACPEEYHDGAVFPFNYAAYQHLKDCIAILRRSGGFMRFNDYGEAKGDLSGSFLALARLNQLTTPINWAIVRALAIIDGAEVEVEAHETHINRWHEKKIVNPHFGWRFVDLLMQEEHFADTISRNELFEIVSRYGLTWSEGKAWVGEDEFLLVPTEEEKGQFMRPTLDDIVMYTLLFRDRDIKADIASQNPLGVDLRYLDFLLARGSFYSSINTPHYRRGFDEGFGGFHRGEVIASIKAEDKYKTANRLIDIMHKLFGERWRGVLRGVFQKADKFGEYLSAKVSVG